MKLCILGNSHIAAVRVAWDEFARRHHDVEADFFAARNLEFEYLFLQDRTLTTRDPEVLHQMRVTSGGKTAIDVDAYDAFLEVGLGLGLASMLRVAARHRTLGTLGLCGAKHLMSDAAFELSARGFCEDSPSQYLAGLIRSVGDRPIVCTPTPYPGQGIVASGDSMWPDAVMLFERFAPLWEETKRDLELKNRLVICEQPAETVVERFFTRDEYRQGAVRLTGKFDKEREEADFQHANGKFGALVLEQTVPLLAAACGQEFRRKRRLFG